MIAFEQGEKIICTVRRHWWVLLSETLFLAVLLIVPPVFYEAFLIFIEKWHIAVAEFMAYFVFFYVLWLLIIWIVFFLIWTNYYLDVWIITNKRMIDVEQKGLFHREVSTFRLDRIQDVTIEVKGILGTFLKFGDVVVQTAGEHKAFIIRDAHKPEEVKQAIQAVHDASMEVRHMSSP